MSDQIDEQLIPSSRDGARNQLKRQHIPNPPFINETLLCIHGCAHTNVRLPAKARPAHLLCGERKTLESCCKGLQCGDLKLDQTAPNDKPILEILVCFYSYQVNRDTETKADTKKYSIVAVMNGNYNKLQQCLKG